MELANLQTWENFDMEKGIRLAREKKAKNLTEELERIYKKHPQLRKTEVKNQIIELNPLDVIA